MTGTEQRLAELEGQVAELHACLQRVAMQTAALLTVQMPAGTGEWRPSGPAQRPRHLRVKEGAIR
jgi:hypothetical protein